MKKRILFTAFAAAFLIISSPPRSVLVGDLQSSLTRSAVDFDNDDESKVDLDVTKDTSVTKVGTGKRVVIDKIVARINGRNLLLSFLKQPQIDNRNKPYTLEEAIDNELLFQRSMDRKLGPSALDIEKYISSWKESSNLLHLNDKELDERLRRDGLTLAKYRNQLGRFLAIKNLRNMEISERIVVTSREVEEYHATYPSYSENKYLLQTKLVPYSMAQTAEEALKIADKVDWVDANWIEESKLAETVAFVKDMNEGDVSEPIKVAHGFQIIKVSKREAGHLETLTERWGEIERILQDKRIKKFEASYIKELREKALIVYL